MPGLSDERLPPEIKVRILVRDWIAQDLCLPTIRATLIPIVRSWALPYALIKLIYPHSKGDENSLALGW